MPGVALQAGRRELLVSQLSHTGALAAGLAPKRAWPVWIVARRHDDHGGTLTLTNTLVDNDCANTPPTSGGHDIECPGDTYGFDQATDQVNVRAEQQNLGPPQDNGEASMTHALLPGSVAINEIPEPDCVDADGAPLTTDQRGEPRPETGGSMCDVGAFEVQP
ncbi:MAG: choice-of-anchor Q domain-containing protein [Polyangiales bacterium]